MIWNVSNVSGPLVVCCRMQTGSSSESVGSCLTGLAGYICTTQLPGFSITRWLFLIGKALLSFAWSQLHSIELSYSHAVGMNSTSAVQMLCSQWRWHGIFLNSEKHIWIWDVLVISFDCFLWVCYYWWKLPFASSLCPKQAKQLYSSLSQLIASVIALLKLFRVFQKSLLTIHTYKHLSPSIHK